MNIISKYQTIIIGLAVVTGLLAGQIQLAESYAGFLTVPFLMLMLFGLFLNTPVRDLLKSFSNLKFSLTSLAINFIWNPIFAYVLGYILLRDNRSLWIGFVMLMVTPCTDWYLIFTGIARGKVPLSASVLPLNLVLQILLLPFYLLLFFEQSGAINTESMFQGILIVLIIPFILAQAFNHFAGRTRNTRLLKTRISPFFEKGQVLFLGLAIMAMFASQGRHLTNNLEVVYILLLPLLLFFTINFLKVRLISSVMNFNYEDSVSLNFITLARNSPVALAVAVAAFPEAPVVALTLVIGPLIELPILALAAQLLLQIRKRKIS